MAKWKVEVESGEKRVLHKMNCLDTEVTCGNYEIRADAECSREPKHMPKEIVNITMGTISLPIKLLPLALI